MEETKFDKLCNDIRNADLTTEQFSRLARVINDLHTRRRERVKHSSEFRSGDLVKWFSGRERVMKTGKLERKLSKNAQVLGDDGKLWRVPMSILEKR